jgi:long-chain fatty acid transport protein
MAIPAGRLAGAAVVSVFAIAQAQASGFALREQSAYGMGWAFAGISAGGPGVSGMYWNPALVNNADSLMVDSSYTFVAPQVKISPNATFPLSPLGGSGDMGQDAFIPASNWAIPLNDRFTAGFSVGAPLGLATNPRDGWAGQLDSYSSKVTSLNVTPTMGWKVNDWLSLGVGMQMQYFKTVLKQNAGIGGPRLTLKGTDDVGFGFTAGVQLKPFQGTEIGFGYRSSITHNINGNVLIGGARLPVATELETPDIVNIGIRQRITDSFLIAGTFEWQNWSKVGTLIASGPGSAVVPALPFNYEDAWFASIGGEYQWSPQLALRAGIAYETSPIDYQNRTTRLPDDNRIWLGAGLTYNWSDKMSIDLGYSYVFAADGDVPVRTIRGGITTFDGEADSSAHIISVGLRHKFDIGLRSAFAGEKVPARY